MFLDRDGVLSAIVERAADGPASARSLSEFRLLEGAPRQVTRLREAGFHVFVVTNQPDIARGLLPPGELEGMHALLRQQISLDDLRVCVHDDADRCECRKPRPGMLLALAREWQVDLSRSFMVGDLWKDVAAGRAAGCRTLLLRRPYNDGTEADLEADDLEQAVDLILETVERT